ncbi:IS66 family transposase, partial [Lactobacillus delbrueckii subsp. bulgaricus]
MRRAGCWAHGRRKFVDGTNGIESQRSLGRKFVKKFDQLFAIERKAQGFSPQQLLEIRQRESKPIVDSIWQLMSETTPINKSKLGRAYTYMVNQR